MDAMQNHFHQYTIKYEPDGEGGYMATVPAIPAIVTGGRTLAEAEQAVKEAIELYLEVLVSEGRTAPADIETQAISQPKFARLGVAVH